MRKKIVSKSKSKIVSKSKGGKKKEANIFRDLINV